MNEVTKIHLGRQAFTISVDAHRELKGYLDAIKRHVSDEGVVSEVELRMAELLAERDVKDEQVILPADVDFLKEQLGNPKDFAEDDEQETADQPTDTKRLFRDTDNAMLAGVAAGLGNYFGVDVLIIRLLFVIATFAGGWGILIYIVLWLLVPEAKTSSERLQMAGKPVTIDSLKEVVERADVGGAARRANNSLAGPVNAAFRTLLKVVGVCFVVIGMSLLLGLATAALYVFFHNSSIVQDNLFPIGIKEHLLVYSAAVVGILLSLFVVLFGMALYRRKWPIHAWITGTLIGMTLIGMAAGGALAADVAPHIRDRYNANLHTTVRTVQPFSAVDLSQLGNGVTINYETAPTYSVSLHYYDHPNLNAIKTSVKDGTLIVNSRQYSRAEGCNGICIDDLYDMTLTISSPNAPTVDDPYAPVPPVAPVAG